jgi:hypothetical protein
MIVALGCKACIAHNLVIFVYEAYLLSKPNFVGEAM